MTELQRIEQLTDVSPERVEEIVQRFLKDGARNITRETQADGKWTVTAEFSDQPEAK